jgi:tetratricopeptide (TPR) repeat protein
MDAAEPQVLGWGLYCRGWVKQATGPVSDAIEDLKAAAELFQTILDHAHRAVALSLLGRCYVQQGQLAAALVALDEAERIRSERGLRGVLVACVPLMVADGHVTAVDATSGPERAEAIRRARRSLQRALREAKAHHYWGAMALRLRGTLDWLQGEHSRAERSWQASIRTAEELRAPYEVALTAREIGRRMDRRDRLEQAEAMFSQLGAGPDAAETYRLVLLHANR